MSRSFKKNPYVKDPGNGKMKRIASRRYRRVIRQLVKPWRLRYYYHIEGECFGCECEEWGYRCPFLVYELEPILPHPYEVTNPCDVCDFSFYWSDPKGKRK